MFDNCSTRLPVVRHVTRLNTVRVHDNAAGREHIVVCRPAKSLQAGQQPDQATARRGTPGARGATVQVSPRIPCRTGTPRHTSRQLCTPWSDLVMRGSRVRLPQATRQKPWSGALSLGSGSPLHEWLPGDCAGRQGISSYDVRHSDSPRVCESLVLTFERTPHVRTFPHRVPAGCRSPV